MRRKALLSATALAIAAIAIRAGATTGTPAPAESRFEAEVAPLLLTHCAICHMTGDEAGQLSLIPDNAIASLVGTKSAEAPGRTRVIPGDPDGSYLVMKLEGTHMAHGGAGARMPFGGPPLPVEEIAKVRKWIAEGARP